VEKHSETTIRQVIRIVIFSLKITSPLLILEGIYLLCDHLKLNILEIAQMGQGWIITDETS
jgi:hypothetical protein